MEAALLQTRDNMSCHRDEASHNSILSPIPFTSKSLTMADKRYSNIEREALGILNGLGKVPLLLLYQGGKYNHRPPTTYPHIQERCSHIVTKTPANPIKNTSVHGQNHIQTQTRLIYSRLAVQTKLQ